MVAPIWLDERGHPHAKRPCPVCGREIPVVTLPPEHLKWYGWQPWQLWSTVEWCGHRVEGIPVPDTDGCCVEPAFLLAVLRDLHLQTT
jgi:hypothetical protein